jgi:hypothetical protein
MSSSFIKFSFVLLGLILALFWIIWWESIK